MHIAAGSSANTASLYYELKVRDSVTLITTADSHGHWSAATRIGVPAEWTVAPLVARQDSLVPCDSSVDRSGEDFGFILVSRSWKVRSSNFPRSGDYEEKNRAGRFRLCRLRDNTVHLMILIAL